MPDQAERFESIARRAFRFSDATPSGERELHPFDQRNIEPELPEVVRRLFDDGHYAQATFEAFKFIDDTVRSRSGLTESGMKLMMQAFDGARRRILLTANTTPSEQDEQEGYRFLFAGAMLAIRNPRGHGPAVVDSPEDCLDHLALASMLLRRLEAALPRSGHPALTPPPPLPTSR